MRIALYWHYFLHYHVARIKALMTLAEELGFEIIPIAVCPGSSEFPTSGYHELLGQQARLLSNGTTSGSMNSLFSAKQMFHLLNEIQPDVVAIPGYDSKVAHATLCWVKLNHKSSILMSDSQYIDFPRSRTREWVKKTIIRNFDSALVAGSVHKSYMLNLGMPENKTFVGYDVVDNEFWSSSSEKAQKEQNKWQSTYSLPEKYFVTSSRLVEKKNVAGLLHSYESYCRSQPFAWPLVIMGDGPLRKDLEQLALTLGVADYVHFLGYLSAEQMAPVYALASVFVLASSHSEQWGLVVNEAMASGLPVLVSNICGCVSDLVVEGVTGFSFNPRDESELTNLMIKCSNGEFDLARMGLAAEKKIEEYSPRVFADNLLAAANAAIHKKVRGFSTELGSL